MYDRHVVLNATHVASSEAQACEQKSIFILNVHIQDHHSQEFPAHRMTRRISSTSFQIMVLNSELQLYTKLQQPLATANNNPGPTSVPLNPLKTTDPSAGIHSTPASAKTALGGLGSCVMIRYRASSITSIKSTAHKIQRQAQHMIQGWRYIPIIPLIYRTLALFPIYNATPPCSFQVKRTPVPPTRRPLSHHLCKNKGISRVILSPTTASAPPLPTANLKHNNKTNFFFT